MQGKSFVFTSESVTEGHPDKIADAISDAVLDANMAQDKRCRVACETLVATGMVVVAGEITSSAWVNYSELVRSKIREIGYTSSEMGFDAGSCAVFSALNRQSPDISQGVTPGQGLFKEQGAGDQGMMFGYACDETPELMPMPCMLAHKLAAALAAARKKRRLPFLRPDGKSQVSVRYEDNRPAAIETVVVSTQHSPDVRYKALRDAVIEEIILKTVPKKLVSKKTLFLVNPTGRFVVGGPQGDTGVTGRKIIVDTYGGMGRHGGGAFSGKDPSKVDRTATYMARHIAKNIVAARIASRCEVQLAYAIGYPEPVSVMVETFGTASVPEEKIARAIRRIFPLKPALMIEYLKLLRPIFSRTTCYGHFGRTTELDVFTWEKTDKTGALKEELAHE